MKVTNQRCKCSACGEYFNSTFAFDKHRKGDYGNEGKNRHCDVSRMVKNSDGYWVTELRRKHELDDFSQNQYQTIGSNKEAI